VSRRRLLVIDADLPKRLAGNIHARGRDAVALSALNLAHGVKDPGVLRGLAAHYAGEVDWVLVTGDDWMPAEHGAVITETHATVATVHPSHPPDLIQHEWRHDIVQRWAHAMQVQTPQTVRRYSLPGSQLWRPHKKHLTRAARMGWTTWKLPSTTVQQDPPPPPADPSEPPHPAQESLPGLN
jgi:hypothetical protein